MNVCILLAGGSSTRTNTAIPKQFTVINNKPVFAYSLDVFNASSLIDHIIIVCLDEWADFAWEWSHKLSFHKVIKIVDQGISRQHSIKNGLDAASELIGDSGYVFIHDAARPWITPQLLSSVLEKASEVGSALPVLKINDAIYIGEEKDSIEGILNQPFCYKGQTPVCVDFRQYYHLHDNADDDFLRRCKGTCTILFHHNQKVGVVEGDERTFKITTEPDLNKFRRLLHSEALTG